METAETFYRFSPGIAPAERAAALYGRPQDAVAMVKAGKRPKSGVLAFARLNHARWIVDCPDPTCSGCQYAAESDRRFFCNYCYNAAAGGGWIDVIWPANREAIEEVLGERLDPRTQNWNPGESLVDLRLENVAGGV